MSEITTIDNQTVATQSDAPSAVTGESVVNKNNCINSLKSYSSPYISLDALNVFSLYIFVPVSSVCNS